ncbi:hypothetical protein AB0F20_10155 [Streptomyces goshikiensis]|uniref:hypothetical protein n=1 Tax=Streptomyces goshikiensis TaxID=1942 RepID=UPI0033DB700A
MKAAATGAGPAHAPGPAPLGQVVFEQAYPPSAPGAVPGAGGWWAFFTCGCCHEQQYEPLTGLPADADAQDLAASASAFWGQPCVLRAVRDGFAVVPGGGPR